MKKLLSVLLAALLGLALLAPAAMAEELPPPVFTKIMTGIHDVKLGETVVLEAEAKLPEGVTADLQYQWYASGWVSFSGDELAYEPIEGATEPTLTLQMDYEAMGESRARFMSFDCQSFYLQAFYTTEDGTVVSSNDYTLLALTYSLDDTYRGLIDIAGPLEGDMEQIFGKILLFPVVFPLFLFGKLTVGYIKFAYRLGWL